MPSPSTYLLTPIFPKVLVLLISGRIQARSFLWSGCLIQSSQKLKWLKSSLLAKVSNESDSRPTGGIASLCQTTDLTAGYITDMAERACRASKPTWGIASLRQTTDFTPGHIAERACRASRPTWGIASLRQTTDFTPGYIAERACRASRPTWGITPGYIAERACRTSRPTWGIASLPGCTPWSIMSRYIKQRLIGCLQVKQRSH
jgi:hypothetical protein